ncbi:hypothetical protein [Moorena sp. SIOASIH]|nr:hypothetical protein [Moorena sp. SIOASIH]
MGSVGSVGSVGRWGDGEICIKGNYLDIILLPKGKPWKARDSSD